MSYARLAFTAIDGHYKAEAINVRTAADVAAAVQVAARTMPVDILVEARSMAEEDNLQSICGPRDLDVFQAGMPRKRPT
jgi:hypothetical protein